MSILPGVTFSYNLRLGHAQEGRAYVFLANFSVELIYIKKKKDFREQLLLMRKSRQEIGATPGMGVGVMCTCSILEIKWMLLRV